ncbi:MAG: family 20 glycosylhydrolase [Bifidobacteriaceae bacterium]|jgi:hexosaminidase|nr:family 20 glycosylhydrolase [Bifidobacteriaceae bacterium]
MTKITSAHRRRLTAGLAVGALSVAAAVGMPAAAGAAPVSIGEVSVPGFEGWVDAPGSVALTAASRVVVDHSSAFSTATDFAENPWNSAQTALETAQVFARDLAEVTGLNLAVGVGAPQAGDIAFSLQASGLTMADAYRLEIGAGVVRVGANTASGLFNGGRTVLQALAAGDDHVTLPNGAGVDTPSLGMRTYTMDVSREYWEPRVVEDVIRQMGWLKQNVLIFHFDDAEYFRLNSPRYPGLAEPGFSYDEATIRGLVELGRQYNVTVMPAFEYPAHVSHKASYFHVGMADGPLEVEPGFGERDTGADATNTCGPAYTHSHLNPDFTFNFMNPKAMRISKEMLDEFVPWFDSPWVHIGGDEVPSQLNNCPAMQAFFASQDELKSLADVEADFINQLAGHLDTLGKRAVVYNGFENGVASDQTPKVRPDVVVQLWTGSNTSAKLAQYDKIMGNGSQYYLVTGRAQSTSYPKTDDIFNAASSAMSLDLDDPKQLGIGMHIWGDDLGWAQAQYLEQVAYYPRAVTAERSWNYRAPQPGQTPATFRAKLQVVGSAPGYVGITYPTATTDGRPIHSWVAAETAFPPGTFDAHRGSNRRALTEVCGLNGMTPLSSNITEVADPVQGLVKRLGGAGSAAGWHMGASELFTDWTFAVNLMAPSTTTGRVQLFDSRTGAREKLMADGSFATQASSIDFALAAGGQVGFVNNGAASGFGYTAPRDQWVQLVFTSSGGETVLYADGAEVGRVGAALPLPRSWFAATRYVQIQGMQIYAEALSAAAVADQYAVVPQPAAPNCQAKVGPYQAAALPVVSFGVAGSEDEAIEVGVAPGPLSLTVPNNQVIDLGTVTLNGLDQLVGGHLNTAHVIDARGTNAGWTLSGVASDFVGPLGGEIAAANLGWSPQASAIAGSLGLVGSGASSAVAPGPTVTPAQDNGLSTAKVLCSAPAGASTGQFLCGGPLQLGIPFSTPSDTYRAVLTLTLV